MALILRLEDLNQKQQISTLNTNKVDVKTYNAGMNEVNTKLQQLQADLTKGVSDAKAYADTLVNGLKNNEIKALQNAINVLNGDVNTKGSVDYKIHQAVEAIIGGAPDTLNTLKEIVDYIQKNDVSIENLIAAVKQSVANLVDNASADYNTLGKIEARIKEVVAAHKTDVENINKSIEVAVESIPAYAFEKDLAISANDTVTLSKVPFGDVMNGAATIYYTDSQGNIVEICEVTVAKDPTDKTGKVYKLGLTDEAKTAFAEQLKTAKAMLGYFWRPIDNK